MKRIAILLLLALLLAAAGCDATKLLPSPSAPATLITATDSPGPSASAEPTPTPKGIAPGAETVVWELAGQSVKVNVPKAWEKNTELSELLADSPDVEGFYAIAFVPEGIELKQESNIGFFYVVKASLWDAQDGRITDTPVNEIGRAGEYVVGYAGSNDNPYVLGTPECELFDELMVPTLGAMEILSVAE